MTIKAVFADIDGTLYSHTAGRIPQSALAAIRDAREQGILVFAATGRHKGEIADLNIDLELDGWITLNGALCYSDKEIWYKAPVCGNDLRALLAFLKENPFPCQFMEEDLMYINMEDDAVRRSLATIHTPYPAVIDPVRALEHDTYMVIPWVSESIWQKVSSRMKDTVYTRWNDLAADAMSRYAGKRQGVEAACRYFGIDPQETAAFGDGPNDLSLFEACGLSIAMGNSSEDVKRAADLIADDIDQDGFEKAVRQYILK